MTMKIMMKTIMTIMAALFYSVLKHYSVTTLDTVGILENVTAIAIILNHENWAQKKNVFMTSPVYVIKYLHVCLSNLR